MRRAIVLGLLLLVSTGCTHLFFQPMAAHVRTPANLGLRYENVWLHSEDGLKLHAWYLPAAGQAKGSVLFLHGNAQNISTHIGSVAWLPGAEFNVLLLDYRGYGLSQGTPSVEGALLDIDAALSHLLTLPELERGPITVFGQSLGGALAIVYVAQSTHRDRIQALIADSAFSDFRAIAKEKLQGPWWLRPLAAPLSWTISNRYRPLEAVAKIAPLPLLLIHGEQDQVVPVSHAHRLHEAASPPKALWLVPGANHIAALSDPALRQRFAEFLTTPGLNGKP